MTAPNPRHVTMTLNWGYLAGTLLFVAALVALVAAQIVAKRFHPSLYWATIIASTTFGTTIADFADRSLGIGYTGGSSILLLCLLATLGLWYWTLGSISVDTVGTPKVEVFYWAAITFSQTLGTALGDWMANSTGLGLKAVRSYSVPRWLRSRAPIIGPRYRALRYFGLPSSLPGHWAPPLAIFSTSPSTMVVSH